MKDILNKILLKVKFCSHKKYLNCPDLKHGIHFFHDKLRFCCTNVFGPIIYNDYNGEDVDWNKVYKLRKAYINKINSPFIKGEIPSECTNCYDAHNFLSSKHVKDFPNRIDKVYIHSNMACNAKCSYCSYRHENKTKSYNVYPQIKKLIASGILSKTANICMSGGEITISENFDDLLNDLSEYLEGNSIDILTSGIKYCKSIEDALAKDKCSICISLDSACPETYFKIKNVDCFNNIVNNLKRYTINSDIAKSLITLKYIIVDGINDNKNEIYNFLALTHSLGIKKVKLDFDNVKYSYGEISQIPEYYKELLEYFHNTAKELNLILHYGDTTNAILKELNIV